MSRRNQWAGSPIVTQYAVSSSSDPELSRSGQHGRTTLIASPLSPSGIPVSETIRTDITTTVDQHAVEEVMADVALELQAEKKAAMVRMWVVGILGGMLVGWAGRSAGVW